MQEGLEGAELRAPTATATHGMPTTASTGSASVPVHPICSKSKSMEICTVATCRLLTRGQLQVPDLQQIHLS